MGALVGRRAEGISRDIQEVVEGHMREDNDAVARCWGAEAGRRGRDILEAEEAAEGRGSNIPALQGCMRKGNTAVTCCWEVAERIGREERRGRRQRHCRTAGPHGQGQRRLCALEGGGGGRR